MKNNHIIRYLLPMLVAGILSSCKDSLPQPDFSKGAPIIELAVASLAGNGGGNSMNAGFVIQTDPTPYFIIVNYAAANANPADVNVTLAVDSVTIGDTTSTLARFERVNGVKYPPLPAGAFSLSNTVTIPKGQRKVQYPIKFNTTLIDPLATYALPLKIVSASSGTISGNFGTLILLINVKNIYDGTYSIVGQITSNSATGPDQSLSGFLKSGLTTSLPTITAHSNSFTQYWKDGTKPGDIDGLFLTVDPTTNKVTVAATGNATLKNTTGYDSRYDPATKTFYLAFDWGTSPDTRLAVDTLTYTGP